MTDDVMVMVVYGTAGADVTGAAGELLASAVHLVQIVDVDVIQTVDVLGAVSTVG